MIQMQYLWAHTQLASHILAERENLSYRVEQKSVTLSCLTLHNVVLLIQIHIQP